MIVLLDNYDSFTYNLVYLLEELDYEVRVCLPSNFQPTIFQDASHIILSPGPKHPKDTPLNQIIIQEFFTQKPILGVCLGHQCIAHTFGAEVIRGKAPIHGKTSKLHFTPCPLFANLPHELEVMRYHSLIVTNLPSSLETIAWSDDEVIMGIKHRYFPLYGVQFHPESILSQGGKQMLQNFCRL